MTKELITEFLETENQRISADNLQKEVRLLSTKDIVRQNGHKVEKLPRDLRPLKRERNLILFFSLINITGFILAVKQFYTLALPLGSFLALTVLFLALLLIPILVFLRFRKRLDILRISQQGITTSTGVFHWNQLKDTLILKVPNRKTFKNYLVLVTKKNQIFKYDLKFFLSNDLKLATAIEKFK